MGEQNNRCGQPNTHATRLVDCDEKLPKNGRPYQRSDCQNSVTAQYGVFEECFWNDQREERKDLPPWRREEDP